MSGARGSPGPAAAEALFEDPRIDAVANLAGYLDHPPPTPDGTGEPFPVARYGVHRPLLMLRPDGFPDGAGLQRSWHILLAHPGDRTRVGRLTGAAHWAFTDYAAMALQLQAAGLMPGGDRDALVGPTDANRTVGTVRGTLRSFFTAHLPVRN